MFGIKLIIKLSSVTYAFKARELLNRKNIKSTVMKNPKPSKGEGCGYILIVENAKEDVIGYLKENKIAYKEAVLK